MNERRFRAPGGLPTGLAIDDLRVVCPRCSRRAEVTVLDRAPGRARRLTCPACTHSARWPIDGAVRGGEPPAEPFHRRPPWLRGGRRGSGAWAFHRRTVRDLRGPRRGRPPRR